MRTDKREPIDVVVTYVDGSDPTWQRQYEEAGYKVSESSNARFRSNNQFVFFFRALAQNATFVNRVFLVVSTESQTPEWVNRETVTVITHDQIIPHELLPAFNSNTIEMFLHNIPDLSEQFIYCNDDCFFFAPTSSKDFFQRGKACVRLQTRSLDKATTVFRKISVKTMNLAYDGADYPMPPSGKYYTPYHVALPMLRSNNTAMFNKHRDTIMESCTRKRSSNNVSQYLYVDSLVFNRLSTNYMPSHEYVAFTVKKHNTNEICRFIRKNDIKLVCINDNSQTPRQVRCEIVKALSERFPNKCKYENDTVKVVDGKPISPSDRVKDNEKRVKAVLASRFHAY